MGATSCLSVRAFLLGLVVRGRVCSSLLVSQCCMRLSRLGRLCTSCGRFWDGGALALLFGEGCVGPKMCL